MNNCGIDGSEFTLILKGLQNLKDFKAITYRKSDMSQEALPELAKLFQRKIPYHLEELRLVELRVHSQCIEDMLSLMTTSIGCQIKILSLVRVNFQERSFDTLLRYVENSDTLQ